MKKKFLMVFAVLLMIFLLFSGCTTEQNGLNQDQTNNDGANDDNDTEVNEEDDTSDESGFITFDYPPFDLEKVAFICPMGALSGGHVTPVDHQYYISYDFNMGDQASVDIDIYSPGDGRVISIEHMGVAAGDPPVEIDDFRLVIRHTSTISSYYIHVDELSEKLAAVAPPLGNYASVDVAVEAGEVIGRYGGSVDYNIADEDVILSFVNLESYENEVWKIHCADPFNYFNEPIKSQMIEKCLRTEEPFGGKIDYDIDGRLVGTWFEENTNKYGGLNQDRYWAGHLTIAYDSIDPDHIIVSIGTFIDSSEQFGVKGNTPDPTDVSVETGIVKYELVGYDHYDGDDLWDGVTLVKGLKVKNNDDVGGVVLFQLIEDQKLKVEIFPNETAETVSGFTENVMIYER